MDEEIQVDDTVTIQQQYGRAHLRLVGDEYRWVYRRRTRRGIVRRIMRGNFPDTAFIKLDDESHIVGVPLSKVTKKG